MHELVVNDSDSEVFSDAMQSDWNYEYGNVDTIQRFYVNTQTPFHVNV